MMVAVASPLSPPQHWPMFGHRASSQTVWSLRPRRSDLILLKLAEVGISVLRYRGRRGLCRGGGASQHCCAGVSRADVKHEGLTSCSW